MQLYPNCAVKIAKCADKNVPEVRFVIYEMSAFVYLLSYLARRTNGLQEVAAKMISVFIGFRSILKGDGQNILLDYLKQLLLGL